MGDSDIVGALLNPVWVNVKDVRFAGGAKGDGVVDDGPAFRAALEYLLTQQQVYGDTFTSYTGRLGLMLPGGIYRITEPLPFVGIRSDENAVIVQCDPTQDIFDSFTTYRVEISGVHLRGGRDAIHIDNNHVTGLMVCVTSCTFADQTRSALDMEPAAQSASLVVRSCDFFAGRCPTALLARILGCDAFVMQDCMIQGFTSDVFQFGSIPDGSAGIASLTNIFASPASPAVPGAAWINLQAGQVRCRNFRFGGEPGLKPMLRCYGGDRVDIQSCDTFAPMEDWNYRFYGTPLITAIRDNFGQGLGLWFDPGRAWTPTTAYALGDVVQANGNSYQCLASGTSAEAGFGPSGTGRSIADGGCTWAFLWIGTGHRDASFRTLGNGGRMDVEGFNGDVLAANGQAGSIAGGDPAQVARAKTQSAQSRECEPLLADLALRIYQGCQIFDPNGASTNIAVETTTNVFGARQTSVSPAGLGNGNYANAWLSAMNGFPDGVYTAVFDVTVSGQQAYLTLEAGDVVRTALLEAGRHLVHVPFTIDAARQGSRQIGHGVIVQNGSTCALGTVDVFHGRVRRHSGQRLSLVGAAPPTRGAWFVGDEIELANPTSGNYRGQVCTRLGVVGAPWTADTPYQAGDQVTNGGQEAYICRQAGVSGPGPGPTGTNPGQTDGGVVWDAYGNPIAEFRDYGPIS